jgi:hypothetical protein
MADYSDVPDLPAGVFLHDPWLLTAGVTRWVAEGWAVPLFA